MSVMVPRALGRGGVTVLMMLAALAVGAWALLVIQPGLDGGLSGLTMGMGPLLFVTAWLVMMVAMMVPAAAPMVVMFVRVSAARRSRGDAFVPAWVFVAAYFAIWTAAGAVAYVLAVVAEALALQSSWVTANAPRLAGALIALAGAYQLSPLKDVCLTHCRSPLSFVMHGWRDGYIGAVRMGLVHGGYCLGCCWLLFALLFPLGLMNLGAMVVLTVLVLAEKSLPVGPRLSRIAGVLMLVAGLTIVAVPALFPTLGMSGMSPH